MGRAVLFSPRFPNRPIGLCGLGVMLFAWALAGACAWAEVAAVRSQGVLYDDHETAEPSWRTAGGDAAHRLDGPKRTSVCAHHGTRSEHVGLEAGVGTSVLLYHELSASSVISELTASVWIKADRAGPQILARVVLPRTEDPRTGKPLSIVLRGSSYVQPGTWQQLILDNLPTQLTQYARALRSELKHDADIREAYVDRIQLNIYSGQGTSTLYIDDLEVRGMANAGNGIARAESGVARPGNRAAESGVRPIAFNEPASQTIAPAKPPQIKQQGAILSVDGKAFFPRGIQYQGEPLEHLSRLGFNTIFLSSPPTAEICQEAMRLNMWIVAPPPVQPGSDTGRQSNLPTEFGPQYDRVLAWNLGMGLSGSDLSAAIQLAKQIRGADQRMHRLILCSAEADLRSFSRHADVLLTQRNPLGTSLELADYAVWLRERPRLARPGTPTWTGIQTQLLTRLQEQQSLLSRGRVLKPVVDEETIRLLTRSALASGVRGMCFQSQSRLDMQDADSRLRAVNLALINLELDLIEPWSAGGTFLATASCGSTEVVGAVMQTERAKLLLPMRMSQGAQSVPRPASLSGLKFVIPGVSETNQVFELTPAGFKSLAHKRVAGGISVELGESGLSSLIVMTQDPFIIQSLTKRTESLARTAATLQRESAAANLSLVEAVHGRLSAQGHRVAEADACFANAKMHLQQADTALAAGDFSTAYLKGRLSVGQTGLVKRVQYERAAGIAYTEPSKPSSNSAKPDPIRSHATANDVRAASENSRSPNSQAASPSEATPFLAAFNTLPQHWELKEELRLAQPGPNLLPAGSFEDLTAMIQSGWQHFAFPQAEIKTDVELSPQGAASGRFGLHLRAFTQNQQSVPPLIEATPVWITSPSVQVEAGTLLVITGKIKINSPITGSVDGAMIFDSIGGDTLAERVGETRGWKDFTIYRVAPRSGPIQVTIALTGLGDVYVDEVAIRPLTRVGTPYSPTTTLAPASLPNGPPAPRQAIGLPPSAR